jgi:hypothetical protein
MWPHLTVRPPTGSPPNPIKARAGALSAVPCTSTLRSSPARSPQSLLSGSRRHLHRSHTLGLLTCTSPSALPVAVPGAASGA